MMVHIRQCYFLNSSYPLHPLLCPQLRRIPDSARPWVGMLLKGEPAGVRTAEYSSAGGQSLGYMLRPGSWKDLGAETGMRGSKPCSPVCLGRWHCTSPGHREERTISSGHFLQKVGCHWPLTLLSPLMRGSTWSCDHGPLGSTMSLCNSSMLLAYPFGARVSSARDLAQAWRSSCSFIHHLPLFSSLLLSMCSSYP